MVRVEEPGHEWLHGLPPIRPKAGEWMGHPAFGREDAGFGLHGRVGGDWDLNGDGADD